MAGTLVLAIAPDQAGTRVKKITGSATSSAGGAADSSNSIQLNGLLLGARVKPGASVSSGFAFTILDADGLDLLVGGGGSSVTNNVNKKEYKPLTSDGVPPSITGPITVSFTGLGNAKTADIEIDVLNL